MMRRVLLYLVAGFLMSFVLSGPIEGPQWISFEEAVDASKMNKRKIFIDVYTDWCGWCKRMDAATFSDPRVAKELQTNFYPVKFNAEQRESIAFADYTFKFVPSGSRGYHELAAALLNGKLSYPSVVFMNEKFEIIQVLPGYRGADEFLKIATFIGQDHYLTTPWEEYSAKYDAEPQTN